ncbi:MAG: hypothetical protein WD669_04805 [Pirellulales bacterium]
MMKLSRISTEAFQSRSLIVLTVFFATLANSSRAFTQESGQRPAAAQTPVGEAEPFTGVFSNGVKIELVGLSQHPAMGQPWWTPDGMAMKERPYGQNRTMIKLEAGQMAVEFCWRWIGLPEGDRPQTKWEVSPTAKARQEIVPTGPDGNRPSDLQAAAVAVPIDDDFLIRFSLPIRGAATGAPAFESIEFRGVSLLLGNYNGVSVFRISPDGKEERLAVPAVTKALLEQERNSPELKEAEERAKKERALEKALGEQPAYRLAAGERFKHAPPPFSTTRQEYWVTRSAMPGRAPDPTRPGFMTFQRVNGELDWKSASFGTPTIGRLLDRVFNIKSHRIEGGESLLATELSGDWVLTWDPNGSITGDPQKTYAVTAEDIEAFERIVQDELIEIVDFELREVKRPVYVVKGTYKYTQVPDPDGKMRALRSDSPDEIKLLAGSRQKSGSFGNFANMLERIGEFLNMPFVDETTTKTTKRQIQVSIFGPPPADAKPLDQATIDAALAGLTTQTGYTFSKEERPVKMLFIKRGIRE